MLGAVVGDIVGSVYEWHNIKTKDFPFFSPKCFFTDDSVMSLAIAGAILECDGVYRDLDKKTVEWMQGVGVRHPHRGYGGHFNEWLHELDPQPYNSWGNGSAMRVSACGFAANSLAEAIELSRATTAVTHNHPEGLKGAEATAVAVYMARTGSTIEEIKAHICSHYYDIDFTLDEIRPSYRFDVSCMGTVPQALEAFFESDSFEDAIRNAISIGGDSDTLAAITGAVAEAYYGIPQNIRESALAFLDSSELVDILERFEAKYPPKTV